MNNDLGISKSGLSPTERASPSAKTGDTEATDKSTKKPEAEESFSAAQAEIIAEEVVVGLNDLVQDLHRELKFTIDHESGDMVIKVIDQETDEVVREIPSEEVVRLRKRLKEAEGIIFRDSA